MYLHLLNNNNIMGIGDWRLGPIPNPQSPIPNPQSPIPIKIIKFLEKQQIELNYFYFKLKYLPFKL